MPDTLDNIINELTELTTELYEYLLRTEGSLERPGWYEQLEQFARKTLRIRLLAGQGDRIGLHDACMQQQEYLRALAARGVIPTPHEWDRLERWPLLLLPCLITPVIDGAVEELIVYYRHNTCAIPFSENDAQILRTNLLKPARVSKAGQETNIVTLPVTRALPVQHLQANTDNATSTETTVRYLLQHELLDTVTEYLSVADRPDTTSSEQAQALRLCADRIQLLGISAAGSDLIGLMDCCLLCQGALMKRLDAHSALSATGREQIKIWTGLVARYLDVPDSAEVVDALLAFYQRGHFIPAMLECEYDSLREFLLLDTTAPLAPRIEIKTVPERTSTAQIVTMPFLLRDVHAEVPTGDEIQPSQWTDEMNATRATDDPLDLIPESVPLSAKAREFLQLVRTEISQANVKLGDALNTLANARAPDAERYSVLTEYMRTMDRFAGAAQAICLAGIHAVIVHVISNLRAWQKLPRALTTDERDVLGRWPAFVMNYLSEPGKADSCAQLLAWLASPLWASELPDYELTRIEQDLQFPVVTLDEEHSVQRAIQAHAEDVVITLPQDVNPKLLETLLQELPQHAAEFSACINRIAQRRGTLADVETAQRNAHTLKGAANTVGVVGIATLTHHIEDILTAYAKQQQVPDGKPAATLLAASDMLEMMTEALLRRGDTPEHAQASLQDIINLANVIDADGLPPVETAPPLPRAPEQVSSQEKPVVVTPPSEVMLRVPANVIDDLLRLVGESVVITGQLQERLRLSQRQAKIGAEQNTLLQQLIDALEQHVDHSSRASFSRGGEVRGATPNASIHSDSELHSVTRRIVEAATDAREISRQFEDHLAVFGDLIPALVRINKDSQEAVMRTRMVPINSIVARLQRSVRQTCRVTGKQVTLKVSGAETLLDSDILNALVDPLMHLLRNAIDHGIESAEMRRAAGKSEVGTVELRCTRDGDHFIVHCCDDGAGLDYARIQQVAAQQGLIDSATSASDAELNRLILLPGFTTRSESTQTSGRGIGLDVVHARLAGMKGSMAITSQTGRGCSVELRIPLTMMSIHALLVKSRTQVLAISSRCVEQILSVGSGQVQVDGHRLQYRVGDATYDACEVERLLHLPIDRSWPERADRPALLVRDSTGQLRAVFVEQVLAAQDLVVKQLGPFLPNIFGIDGATILGNGGVAAVVDLPGLLQTMQPDQDADSTHSTAPLALVVDDSLSARRTLVEFAEGMGFDVITANDGIAALEVVIQNTPDVMLTDMEMPRLNGLELTERLRAMPRTKRMPIIMISARSTQNHREQALKAGVNAYLTKPFSEDQLAEHLHALMQMSEHGASLPVT